MIKATVTGAGVHLHVDPDAASAGNNPLAVSLKAPTGIGLSIDTGLVRGGGFLGVRPGGFGGALQLRLGPIDVKAVGLLTVEPSFALVVVMSVEFIPAIDLSFGFTLNAVGGILGIEHRLDTDALRAKISDGALDHIMFPDDPVAAAPAILDTLEQVFPVDHGSIVIGPMIEIGWGRPISFLTAQLGVILSLPDPKIVIIGRVRIALPAPELPIVDLRATVYGEITPDHLLILVSLQRLADRRLHRRRRHRHVDQMGRRRGVRDQRRRIPSALHPAPAAGRDGAAGDGPVAARDPDPAGRGLLRADHATASSWAVGWRWAPTWAWRRSAGTSSFDALVIFAPHFMFMIDLGIGLTVRALGVTLCGRQHPAPPGGPGAVAGRGLGRGRDPLVGRWTSTSAPSPGATTTIRRRSRPTRVNSSTTPSTTTPARGRRSRPPGADRAWCKMLPPSRATRGHRASDRPVRRAPARGAARDRDHPAWAPIRCPRGSAASFGLPSRQRAGRRRRARSPTCSRPATSST